MRAGFKARQARTFAVHKAMREANTYKRPELRELFEQGWRDSATGWKGQWLMYGTQDHRAYRRGFEAGEAWREANPEEETH